MKMLARCERSAAAAVSITRQRQGAGPRRRTSDAEDVEPHLGWIALRRGFLGGCRGTAGGVAAEAAGSGLTADGAGLRWAIERLWCCWSWDSPWPRELLACCLEKGHDRDSELGSSATVAPAVRQERDQLARLGLAQLEVRPSLACASRTLTMDRAGRMKKRFAYY